MHVPAIVARTPVRITQLPIWGRDAGELLVRRFDFVEELTVLEARTWKQALTAAADSLASIVGRERGHGAASCASWCQSWPRAIRRCSSPAKPELAKTSWPRPCTRPRRAPGGRSCASSLRPHALGPARLRALRPQVKGAGPLTAEARTSRGKLPDRRGNGTLYALSELSGPAPGTTGQAPARFLDEQVVHPGRGRRQRACKRQRGTAHRGHQPGPSPRTCCPRRDASARPLPPDERRPCACTCRRLRERGEDVLFLLNHFLRTLCPPSSKRTWSAFSSKEALRALARLFLSRATCGS